MAARKLSYLEIGLQSLTRQRQDKPVPCRPGGSLADYVPFYFCYRSIMLYQIHTGQSDYQGGQEPILHWVTTYEKLVSREVSVVFTDRHAKTAIAQFFESHEHLGELDWEAIRSQQFRSTYEDPDRPERKQAELLAHRFVPIGAFVGIGVYSQRQKEICDNELRNAGQELKVKVMRQWYY